MGKRLNISPGDRFGRLIIIKEAEKQGIYRHFLCKCDCGKEKVILMNSLVRGRTVSCGCYSKEINLRSKPERRKNKRGIYSTILYSRWCDIKKRCYNKNCRAYKWYGNKNIKVCAEWLHDFNNFYDWAIKTGFKPNLTIDRKDFSRDYEPLNCRWIPLKKQNSNKSSNRFIEYKGSVKPLNEWAEILKINYHTLVGRLGRGWTIEKAFNKPIDERFN